MSRRIEIAAIQMDANPAPTDERLDRAGRLVTEAVGAGAEWVVLPELFNTGYAYADSNYRRAETLDGPTVTWMKETAARLGVHLAGSLMLLDQDEVYNALLLFAPDGRMWRYDKIYPWGWERGYFRNGRDITVADTDLGRVGMMICWDVAHLDLWRRYAGRVDLLLSSSCPPDISDPVYHFPGGGRVTMDQLGPLVGSMKGLGRRVWGEMFNEQAAWLGVPAVNTVGTGHIQTDIPNGVLVLLAMLPLAPWLIRYLPQGSQMRMSCDMVPGCKVVDATGQVLTELTQDQGETFTLAEVALAEGKPRPRSTQPRSRPPFMAYLMSDVLLPWLSIPVYRRGLRQAWGENMAPVEASTRQWVGVLGLGMVVSFLVGMLLGHRRRKN